MTAGKGIGCTLTMLAVNTVLIGLLASSFARGPFSSFGQEAWYRYGSLGFFLCGSILPAVALMLGARRSPRTMIGLTCWMFVVLFACLAYAFLSGGGV